MNFHFKSKTYYYMLRFSLQKQWDFLPNFSLHFVNKSDILYYIIITMTEGQSLKYSFANQKQI